MFTKLITFIAYSYRVILVNPKIYWKQIWYSIIIGKVFNKKIDITININDNKFLSPNLFDALYTINECFDFELYKKLKWLDNVLDVGWYLWESAIYFARYNRRVDVYEAESANYDYLIKNTSYYKNINAYHYALTWIKDVERVKFHKGTQNDTWWWITDSGDYEVPAKYIIDVIKSNKYDWLKLDIEWAEYDIIKAMIEYDVFTFIKWYIEFHDVSLDKHNILIIEFIGFLQKRWIEISFEDIYGKGISQEEALHEKIFVLYFELL